MHAFQAHLSLFFALSAAAGGDNKTADDAAAALRIMPYEDSPHCAGSGGAVVQPLPLLENYCVIDLAYWVSLRLSSPFPKKCTNGRDMYLAVYREPLCRGMARFWRAGDGGADFDGDCVSSKAVGEYKSVSLICRKGEGDDGPPNGTEFQSLWTRTSLLGGDVPGGISPSLTASSAAISSTPLSAPFTPTATTSSAPLPSESSPSPESTPGKSVGAIGYAV